MLRNTHRDLWLSISRWKGFTKKKKFVCVFFVFLIQNGYLNIILDISPTKLLQAGWI